MKKKKKQSNKIKQHAKTERQFYESKKKRKKKIKMEGPWGGGTPTGGCC